MMNFSGSILKTIEAIMTRLEKLTGKHVNLADLLDYSDEPN